MLPYALTIFLSAFLLFLVQPIIAKQILPWFGGSAAVWTTCLVFFQSTLLAGYAYADLTHRLGLKRQTYLHIGLLTLSLLTLAVISMSAIAQEAPRARARDLGVAPGIFATGTHNAITDVAGVRVGQGCAEAARAMARRCASEEGMLVGISSGATLAAISGLPDVMAANMVFEHAENLEEGLINGHRPDAA